MKKQALFAGLALSALCSGALGQGSLTPPGPPGPSMRSLDQLEARTPITFAPYTINAPGSYYLANNLTVSEGNAVTVAVSGVTLDLNGFGITSTANPAQGTGILIFGTASRVTIRNGSIAGGVTNNGGVYSGSGFAGGIHITGSDPVSVSIENVSVQGCLVHGINIGFNGTSIRACTATAIGGFGLLAATVSDSVATDCGLSGINARIAQNCAGATSGASTGDIGVYASEAAINCVGTSASSSGTGLRATAATNCRGTASGTGEGIQAESVTNCHGVNSGSGYGLYAARTAAGCFGESTSGDGLTAPSASNCYGRSSSGYGLVTNIAGSSIGTTETGPVALQANNAQNCIGSSGGGGTGLKAFVAENSSGGSLSGIGIEADQVIGCYGASTTGTGIDGKWVTNSFGRSQATGIEATMVINSEGRSDSPQGHGIDVFSGVTMSVGSNQQVFSARVGPTPGPLLLPP